MDALRAIVSYWRDCTKAESALEQSFGVDAHNFTLHEQAKARLFKGQQDHFIFAPAQEEVVLRKGKVHDYILRAGLKGQDIYFGYPLLMFLDRGTGQNHVAPLFTIRLTVAASAEGLTLSRAESIPTLGSCAFTKLGLNAEEVVALNSEVSTIFEDNKSSKLEVVLYLLKKRTKLTFVEGIDPQHLSSATTVHPYDGTVVYNKAALIVGDASVYNIHLLNDLERLVKRSDLSQSALDYIAPRDKNDAPETLPTPILPFAFDEYHLQAIQHIMANAHSVITGPPGTGKSQFIANLIINMFLQKKRILFVSHTGEAVRVVNERINNEFMNLMMQTGKKELRQELGARLEEMVTQYNDQRVTETNSPTHQTLANNWATICRDTAHLRQTDAIQLQLEATNLKRAELATAKSGFLKSAHAHVLDAQSRLIMWRLRNRTPAHQLIAAIEDRKARHVDLSRSYVRGTYLQLILDNGLYGDLVAYIDAVQNRKFNTHSSPDKSDAYIHAALKAMNIWSCTLKSLGASFPLKAHLFDYVIFDEASQIDLPSAAPALYRAKRSVVVGDENQLNHIAKINTKVEEGLAKTYALPGNAFYPSLVRYTDTSLFLSAKKALHEPELELKNHYRSNAKIANLFSRIFYDGRLRIFEPATDLPKDMKTGVYWLDAKGASYKYKAGSCYNPYEASYIVKLLQKILPMAKEKKLTIGITTPYAKQQSIIAEKAAKAFAPEDLERVQILTIHKFQGSEVDILIFSPVLATKGAGTSDYWYTRSSQLLNVAVSRARHLLLIVGDQSFALKSESKLRDIASYCLEVAEPEGQRNPKIPNRPMNIFEKQLLDILKPVVTQPYHLEPQHVVGGRFTVDFALLSAQRNIAIELDGAQHEIIGGLPVFADKQRDDFLKKEGWIVIRISVYDLLRQPEKIIAKVVQAQHISEH